MATDPFSLRNVGVVIPEIWGKELIQQLESYNYMDLAIADRMVLGKPNRMFFSAVHDEILWEAEPDYPNEGF